MISAVIIDDEKNSRMALRNILKEYCPEVHVVGEGAGVKDGLQLLYRTRPHLAFLDIQMQDGTGFDLIKQIEPTIDISFIFVTAYNEYAIQAFEYSAVDYLLKPIEKEKLMAAVSKQSEKTRLDVLREQLETFIYNMDSASNSEIQKIILRTADAIYVVHPNDIIRCQAEINYTKFFLTSGKEVIIAKTLKSYEKMFSKFSFFRPHKAHLINLNHIIKIKRGRDAHLILSDDSKVPLAIEKKPLLFKIIKE